MARLSRKHRRNQKQNKNQRRNQQNRRSRRNQNRRSRRNQNRRNRRSRRNIRGGVNEGTTGQVQEQPPQPASNLSFKPIDTPTEQHETEGKELKVYYTKIGNEICIAKTQDMNDRNCYTKE